ncbi:MAG: phosphoglycerate kinase, partial [Staphylococcus epidermidis]|nr:phosphoglycerate kinase [Staphylococcus epidermidis]
ADLAAKLGQEVQFIPGVTRGAELEAAVNALEDGQVLLVENTRFEDVDGKKESKNDPELGKYWASLGDGIFVNDAFGTAHRAHASNVGISANVEKAVAGFLLENEIAYIKEAVEAPERPFVAILGGSKVSDKIGVIENLLEKADKVLIGGGMTYTFYKAQGIEIGNSLVEEDKLDVAKALLEKSNGKLILPVDSKEANAFADYTEVKDTEGEAVDPGFLGLDIGPKSIAKFDQELTGAKTVVWNGPMGVFEFSNFAKGTIGVCESIAKLEDATTIIGGGDSAAAAISLGFEDDFTHISTGGGASLEYLEGKELPGIKAINDK